MVAITTANTNTIKGTISNTSGNEFTATSYDFIVIGYQQWGYISLGSSETATITLPITILELLIPLAASATKNGNPRYTNCVAVTKASSSTLTITHSGDAVAYYWFILAN